MCASIGFFDRFGVSTMASTKHLSAHSRFPIVFDTSALLCRYLPDRRRPIVDEVMSAASFPVVTSLTRTEVTMGLHLAADRSRAHGALDDAVRSRMWSTGWSTLLSRVATDWDRFWVLPVGVDGSDGGRAAELGAAYGLNLANALHLVALDRLPRPAGLLTFDDRQIAAAAELGIEIVELDSASAARSTAHGLLVDPS
jgi:predicted nucleic acid-binding protein